MRESISSIEGEVNALGGENDGGRENEVEKIRGKADGECFIIFRSKLIDV